MGPLEGIRIVEFAGIGPGPFAGMMLADMGAEIIRIDRKNDNRPDTLARGDPAMDIPSRGRKSVALDLKDPSSRDVALKLVEKADALIEGFRPGVMERLGLGPDDCHARNPKLVYGRMTGWGQDGPLAKSAGHDINYIALSGALWAMGEADRNPVPPLNLLGDFGGGGMMLAYGIVCGVLKARHSGRGDVVDAAVSDGTTALMAPVYSQLAKGTWTNARASNRLDGAAPYYGVYRCADDKWICIGSLEPQFWSLLLELLDLSPDDFPDRLDPDTWPQYRAAFEQYFTRRSRDEWCALLEGTDVCFAPVLDLKEAPDHAHNRARNMFVDANGVRQPAPSPRFRNSTPELPGRPPYPGQNNEDALIEWGFSTFEVLELMNSGVLGQEATAVTAE